ncbi:MAG TPA: hypothetical protein DCP47_01410 [Phycisphaerales bacterium]|nr:hypothetical protein [Phycisphaerales bacterium]
MKVKRNRLKRRRIKNQPGRCETVKMFFARILNCIAEFFCKKKTELFPADTYFSNNTDEDIEILKTQCLNTPRVFVRVSGNRGRHWDRKRNKI